MKFASAYIISMLYLLICCGPAQSDVSLRVSPERSRFFQRETISLSCEEEGKSMPGWSVKRQSSEGLNTSGTCSKEWGTIKGGSCIVVLYRWDNGLYWCESKSGQRSRSRSITISDGDNADVILQSPVLPVMEGSDVMLRCLYKDKRNDNPSFDLPADFYKNGSLIGTQSTGQMTIHNVYKSDKGFYKCNISDLGESPESWMDVRDFLASKDNDQSDRLSPSLPPSSSLPPYFYPLMCAFLLILGLILGLCLGRKCKEPCCVKPVQSQGTNQSGAPDDVYLPLQHVDTSTYGVIKQSDDYENDPVCVRPVQSQGTNQNSAADQRTNQSPDDLYCPLQHGDTSMYGVIQHSH